MTDPVLIDFAHSGPGPLAVDFARLHADLFRVARMNGNATIPLWSDEAAGFWRDTPAFRIGSFSREDQLLFNVLTWIYLVAFLAYEDIEASFGAWLRQAIPKFTRRLEEDLKRTARSSDEMIGAAAKVLIPVTPRKARRIIIALTWISLQLHG